MASILDILGNALKKRVTEVRANPQAAIAAQEARRVAAQQKQPEPQPVPPPPTAPGIKNTVADILFSLPKAAVSGGKVVYSGATKAASAIDRAATPVGGVSPITGYQSPIKRESPGFLGTLGMSARATTDFAGNIGIAGNETAKIVIPQYRAMATIPKVISAAVNELPEWIRGYVGPLAQGYAMLKSPSKIATATGIGLDYAAEGTSKMLTGKGVQQNIDESSLPQWGKDIATVGSQLVPSLLGAKIGSKVERDMPAYQSAGKYLMKNPTDIAGASKAFDTKLARIARDSVPTADVLGYRQVGKKVASVVSGQEPEALVVKKKTVGGKTVVDQDFKAQKVVQDPTQMKTLQQRQEELGLDKRQVRHFKDMEEGARYYDDKTDELFSTNKALTTKEILAYKNIIAQDSDFIAKNQLNTIPKDGDTRSAEIVQMKVDQANARINTALKKLIPAGTEAGRNVVSFKLLANKSMDPEGWIYRAQKNKGVRDLTAAEVKNIRDLSAANDRTGMAMYVSSLKTAGLAEKVATAWKAGLLSSPTTHVRNFAGSAAMAVLKAPEQILATAADIVASKFTGNRSTSYSPIQQIKGFGKGARDAAQVFATGIHPSDMDKVDMRVNPIKNPVLKKATDTVFRSLGAADALFKGSAYQESIGSQAKVIGANSGLKGAAKKKLISDLISKPTDDMQLNAKQAADVATFNQDSKLASWLTGLKQELYQSDSANDRLGALALDVATPFVKTPVNVAKATAQRTPLGMLTTLAKQISPTTRSQKDLVEGIGKSVTGTAVIALGAMLFRNGMATGNAPVDQKERDLFYEEGKKPNAVKIGDTWYQLNSIAPIGALLTLGSEFERLGATTPDQISQVMATIGAGAKGLLNQTFVKGLSDAIAATLDPDRNAGNFTENLVSSTVPNIVTRIAGGLDPVMRNPEGIVEAVKAKIPGLSQTVPARIGLFGEEVNRGGGLVKSLFDAFNTGKANSDTTLKELQRVGADIGLPSNRMQNTQLDNKEYAQFQSKQGKALKKVLDQVVASEAYKALSDLDKRDMIEKATERVADLTKDAVLPEIYKKRYSLPESVDSGALVQVVSRLNSMEEFKSLPPEKQQLAVSKIMAKLSTQPQ
jgi:hypothetical protein